MLGRCFLFAGLLGLPAVPSVAEIVEGAPVVRLLSPASGDRLEAGKLARIEWSAYVASEEPFTEWEAFISVDGGRTFPIRLTPHLDLQIYGFAFETPNAPTDDARILLRFGDERNERVVEIPTRFSIEPSRGGDPWALETAGELLVPNLEPGEAARPGDRGVVVWMEGDREGRGLRPRIRMPRTATYGEARAARSGWLLTFGGPENGPPRLEPPGQATADPPTAPSFLPASHVHRTSVPVRLAIHRFNE